jgi:hypothetical protein
MNVKLATKTIISQTHVLLKNITRTDLYFSKKEGGWGRKLIFQNKY